jgi:outer membrane murein-binding lipoprotein Lpp
MPTTREQATRIIDGMLSRGFADEANQIGDLVAERDRLNNEVGAARSARDAANSRASLAEAHLGTAQTAAGIAQRELEDFKAHAQEVLFRVAEQKGYCTEFDDVMEEIGLERRSREWNVDLEVRARVSITVEAASDEEAQNNITVEAVADALGGVSRYVIDDWEVQGVDSL